MPMMYVLVATGFTGALTLVFVLRQVYRVFVPPLALRAYFSPKGGCTDAVVAEILHARREILMLAYGFTSKPIAEALIEAKKRGVHVEVVLDHSNLTEPHSCLPLCLEKGLTPVIDSHHAIAHNKVMLIDHHTLITGSFNFTNQAEGENAENLLILNGHRELVQNYRQHFDEHKGHSQTPDEAVKHVGQRKAA